MKTRLLLALACLLLAWGCNDGSFGPPAAPPVNPVEEIMGHFAHGFELNSLVPCDYPEESWCAAGPEELVIRYYEIVDLQYHYVYVHVRGIKGPLGSYGHLGQCDREFSILEIIEMRKPLPDDCE